MGTVVFHGQEDKKATHFVGLDARGGGFLQGELKGAKQRQVEVGHGVLPPPGGNADGSRAVQQTMLYLLYHK